MGYQSKTYSLSDEVVAAIETAKANGVTPNQLLRDVLGLNGTKYTPKIEAKIKKNVTPRVNRKVPPAGTVLQLTPDYIHPDGRMCPGARAIIGETTPADWRAGRKPLTKPKDRK